jgi:hypothetical protein
MIPVRMIILNISTKTSINRDNLYSVDRRFLVNSYKQQEAKSQVVPLTWIPSNNGSQISNM